MFLTTEADIAVYGGSAGGGKTFGELLDASQFVHVPGYGAVIFRRTMKQVTDEGGIWDQSTEMFPLVGAYPNLSSRYWTFPGGSTIQFAGLEREASKYDYQGAQIARIFFDELTHFTESQFFYMLSRNRSLCGVRPKIRATTNPDAGSWVKKMLAPWVDKNFPDRAHSGEIRWFLRRNNQIEWVPQPPDRGVCTDGENGRGCLKEGCERCFPPEKSITFIRATVYDNRHLLEIDPGYIANLNALDEVERKRLKDGDWDAKPDHLVLDQFSETVHMVPWRDTTGWDAYAGFDFGSVNGAQVVLKEDPHSFDKLRPDLYLVAENWPGHSESYKTVADWVREQAGGMLRKVGGGNVTTEQGWRQAFRQEQLPFYEPNTTHRDPDLQYKAVNEGFRGRKLFIFETCPKVKAMINSFTRILGPDGTPTDKFDDSSKHLLAALRGIYILLRPPLSSWVYSADGINAANKASKPSQ